MDEEDLDKFLNGDATGGEPDEIRYFETDGITFKESTWNNGDFSVTRIETVGDIEFTPEFFKNTNIPFGSIIGKTDLSLETRLRHALEIEDYEEAAVIRDEMIEKDKNN